MKANNIEFIQISSMKGKQHRIHTNIKYEGQAT